MTHDAWVPPSQNTTRVPFVADQKSYKSDVSHKALHAAKSQSTRYCAAVRGAHEAPEDEPRESSLHTSSPSHFAPKARLSYVSSGW